MTPFCDRARLANGTGKPGSAIWERQLADGRWLHVNEIKTRDCGTVSVGSDITLIKQHQDKLVDSERRLMATIQDLKQAQLAEEERTQTGRTQSKYVKEKERAEAANRAKSEFLANMSTRVCAQPLNAIIGFSEMMQQQIFGPLGSDRYTEYVRDIHSSGNYLLGVITTFWTCRRSRPAASPSSARTSTSIPSSRTRCVWSRCRPRRSRSTVDTKISDTIKVHADRRAIKQIALNLLSNAVKFTGEGGRISCPGQGCETTHSC